MPPSGGINEATNMEAVNNHFEGVGGEERVGGTGGAGEAGGAGGAGAGGM